MCSILWMYIQCISCSHKLLPGSKLHAQTFLMPSLNAKIHQPLEQYSCVQLCIYVYEIAINFNILSWFHANNNLLIGGIRLACWKAPMPSFTCHTTLTVVIHSPSIHPPIIRRTVACFNTIKGLSIECFGHNAKVYFLEVLGVVYILWYSELI